MASKYTLGLDFGTNSARALVVRVEDGSEAGTAVFNFPTGESGIVTVVATLGAFLYNLAAALLGGFEVTLSEDV